MATKKYKKAVLLYLARKGHHGHVSVSFLTKLANEVGGIYPPRATTVLETVKSPFSHRHKLEKKPSGSKAIWGITAVKDPFAKNKKRLLPKNR
jgi:hypothetical protein